jgi:hypothetical protein
MTIENLEPYPPEHPFWALRDELTDVFGRLARERAISPRFVGITLGLVLADVYGRRRLNPLCEDADMILQSAKTAMVISQDSGVTP